MLKCFIPCNDFLIEKYNDPNFIFDINQRHRFIEFFYLFDFLTYIIYFHSIFSNHKIFNQNLIEIFQLIFKEIKSEILKLSYDFFRNFLDFLAKSIAVNYKMQYIKYLHFSLLHKKLDQSLKCDFLLLNC